MQPRDLSAHVAYEAGGGIEEVAREVGLDPADLVALASNENPYGPSPAAVEAIREAAAGVSRYPKAVHGDLRRAIADRWEVEPAQVWLANGGDGALDYLARAMIEPGDRVLVPRPGFAYYGMSARFHHGEVDRYALTRGDDFAQTAAGILPDVDDHRVVYVTSPHNPTGSELDLGELEALADGAGEETLVVVDEAYGEFSRSPSARRLLADRDDVAVLRSFSKVYGLAGIRLGYALVPAEWADAYTRVNTPFAASEVACRAGLAALEDDAHRDRTVEGARWAREHLREELAAPTWPSGGNFVLADVGDGTAVAEAAKREGVVVRDTTSFGLPGCVRVTCGTREETERAVAVLNDVLAEVEV